MNSIETGDFGAHEFEAIMAILADYCDGLHLGDVAKLRGIFHVDAVLKAPGLRRSLEQWLDSVASRPVPAQEGQVYRFKLLSLEVIQDQAMVKLQCPLFGHNYVDFLGLLKESGRWLIVNKMYTDLENDLT